MSTNYLVCYDITEDDVRTAIADICKGMGLVRIQYSVFFGQMERSRVSSLQLQIKECIKKSNADVHIIKICQSCEKDHRVLSSINTKIVKVQVQSNQDVIDDFKDLVTII